MRLFLRIGITALWIAFFFLFLTAAHYLRPLKYDRPTIHIFSWPETLSAKTIKRFEERTGIKVVRHYYTSNEELLVKIKATNSKGYDLIIPSDYAVKKLIANDFLQPIDYSQLTFTENINPRLMHHSYDPENTYSVPRLEKVNFREGRFVEVLAGAVMLKR